MEYSLIEWVAPGKISKRVTLQIADHDEAVRLNLFTDRLIIAILRLLNEAKQVDPSGLYLPITHSPTRSGDEIYVFRDGFVKLEPDFEALVKKMFDEFQGCVKSYSHRVSR